MKTLFRIFIKITGFLPYLIFVKPFIRKDKKKKDDGKKEGCIMIANHTSVFDYYFFLFTYFFRCVHTFASSILYNNFFMKILLNTMCCIKIDTQNPNFNPLLEAEELLKKNKTVLIFPEGHLEKEKGKLEDFKESAIILAFRTNSPIIVHYLDGRYHIFKRGGMIKGKKIYVRQLINKDTLDKDDIAYLKRYLMSEVRRLKNKFDLMKKYKTQTVFTTKYWMLDFLKITSYPENFIVWNTKKIYVGDKKKIKEAYKNNCLLAANHRWACDVFFPYIYMFSRRVSVFASSKMLKHKALRVCCKYNAVIEYNVSEDILKFDMAAFKKTLDILNANGVVFIFPEGHVTNKETMDDVLSPGLATFSLMTKSPIIPFYFVNTYLYFKRNVVIMGEPIYPEDVVGNKPLNNQTINKYNNYITEQFNMLASKGEEYKHDKRRDN